MISVKELTKIFGTNRAVDRISLDIPEGMIFGLLGTNGAGKTTLLRLLSGILEPDSGEILVDDKPLSAAAEKIFYLPDTPYYFPNASMEQMTKFYQSQYPKMDTEGVSYMAESLNLDMRQPLRTFSKGMKRQAFLILALSAGTHMTGYIPITNWDGHSELTAKAFTIDGQMLPVSSSTEINIIG